MLKANVALTYLFKFGLCYADDIDILQSVCL